MFSAVALFCEDIREEKSGQDTIVGILPDNLQLAGQPPAIPNARAILPKLCVYMRINFSIDDKLESISAKVLNTNNEIVTKTEWASAVIDKAFADAKTNQMSMVGLLLKVVTGPFQIASSGKVTVIVTIEGKDYIAGELNIIVPNASAQPASLSPSAS